MSEPLREAILRRLTPHGDADGFFATDIESLVLTRSASATYPNHRVYRPSLCVIAQGAKEVMLGDETFEYDEMQALVVSVELPVLARVLRASPQKPFLGLILEFDAALLREVMEQLPQPPRPSGEAGLGVFVSDLDGPLHDCILRLVRMLDTPQAIPVLYPSLMREIYFWLLTGRHGSEVCKLAQAESHTGRIARALHLIRDDLSRPMRVEALAAAAGMSASSFHQHFKTLTAATPLQYQKQLRLLEARRLMLSDAVNASEAAYQVGYESASQFSREYARMFGAPPRRDVASLRTAPAGY